MQENQQLSKKTTQKFTVKDIAYIALFTAVISVCAFLTIPFQIPFTMQTFGIFTALLVLGGYKGTLSVLVYLLIGAVGVPVFSGFKGGASVLFGVTGGYIIGFLCIGLVYLLITSIFGERTFIKIAGLLAGLVVCYAFGTIWFVILMSQKDSPIGYVTAFAKCVVPYIIPDLAKLVLAYLVSARLKKLIRI